MPFSAGARLGPYEILSALGAGGMGEVYRARDTKLNRDVAIKVLLPAVANDPDRLARFSREAQVLASLNHPNIAHIHGLEEAAGVRALVMELVEGPTLAERIALGPIPLDEALPIAKQITEALEAAHEQGVIHRDLKPANIKVRPDGTVKVLDFGLAKAMDPTAQSSANATISPTLSMHATQAGLILGTAAYMSPEQAAGKPVDRRSDLWSFGVVLLEMLTGRQTFGGETISHVLASVLKDEPDWATLPANTPTSIRRLLRRCLEKDRKRRLDSATAARLEIDEAIATPAAEATAASSRPSKRGTVGWIVAAVSSAAMLALAIPASVHLRETPAPAPQSIRFQIPPPGTSAAEMFTLSPDGRQLAFIANTGGANQLWIRTLNALDARALAGTDGATYPFWSPDGAFVGFFAQGTLKKIAIAGGPAQTLCDVTSGRGGAWNRDGVILFSAGPTSPILRVSAGGGVTMAVTRLADGDAAAGHRFPVFLPDGVHYLYSVNSGTPDTAGLYAGSLYGAPAARILPGVTNTNAMFVPAAPGRATGHLLFRREQTLMAQPFDSMALTPTGDIFPVAEQVPNSVNLEVGAFSTSQNGTLVYRSGGPASNRQLEWVDRTGKPVRTATKTPALLGSFAVSPDQRTVAVTINKGTQSDVWLQDLERDVISRFTFRAGINQLPVWAPDGSRVVFQGVQAGASSDIFEKPSSGGGQEVLLLHGGVNARALDWSPDGKWLVYTQQGQKTGIDLWLLPLGGDRKPIPYLQTPFDETNARFAPSAANTPSWMAYQSGESGQDQIYIQSIPAGGAKYQISTSGGTQPRWRRDGRELFYVSTDRKLMAVPIVLGAGVEAGAAHELFTQTGMIGYAPSPDGQRFLVNVPANGETAAAPPITVVLNWAAGLKN